MKRHSGIFSVCNKVFGEHTFPKFTFDDIKNDKDILYDIHPADLMKITIEDYVISQKKNTLSITEILRDNKYKLSSSYAEEILSGDEICDNILLSLSIERYLHGLRIGRWGYLL
jgi:hypothetical protein